jgi:NADPH2:quinone reductase
VRALICKQWCDFKDLSLLEVAEPELTPGSVRIAVEYAGVSFAHSLVVAGKYQVRPPRPFIPGTEISGIVEDVADDVEHVCRGDRVLAILDWGGFAETAVAPAETVYRLPPDADLAASLHLATSYSTAYVALAWRARLQPGETLLVHGAGGALGLAAVELGRVLNARVIACASTEEKRAAALAHGALLALPSSGFREPVRQATGGRGADVVFDPVGGDVFDESLRSIAPEGRILPVGFTSGRIPQIPANILLVKNVSVLGVYFGAYVKDGADNARQRSAPRVQSMMRELIDWMQAGQLKPTIAGIFDLPAYADAMASVLERRSVGKVLLRFGASRQGGARTTISPRRIVI